MDRLLEAFGGLSTKAIWMNCLSARLFVMVLLLPEAAQLSKKDSLLTGSNIYVLY
jgi:hypothetical protein